MSEALFDEIISNFRRQLELYRDMEQESRRQQEAFQCSSALAADLNAILERRRRLLLQLDELAQANRQMRQEFLQGLGVEEFNLSSLKTCLADGDWSALKEIIDQLAELLRQITAADAQSQELAARHGVFAVGPRAAGPNPNQARQAYESTLRQNKEKPRKAE